MPPPLSVNVIIEYPQNRKSQSYNWSLKDRPTNFHINRTANIQQVKWNKSVFHSNEINLLIPVPTYSATQDRFKFWNQLLLFPQIRNPMKSREESSIISKNSNITGNIIRKCQIKNGASKNRLLLRRLLIQNHPKPSTTKKWQNRSRQVGYYQKTDLEFLKTWVLKKRAKLCDKTWIYQKSQTD